MALALARQIIMLFLYMAGGFILVILKILKGSESKTISKLLVYLVTPCVILGSFQIELSPERTGGFFLSILVAFIIHGLLFAIVYLLNPLFKFSPIEKTSIIYSNSGNLVIPIITALLGSEWVIYASAFLCVQILFVWSHCRSVIEGAPKIYIKKILTNINIITAVIGTLLFFSGIRFPSLVTDTLSGISSVIGPLSMIMVGMILATINWKETLANKRLYLITVLKMVITPFLIMLFLKLSGLASLNPNGQTLLFISLVAVITPSAATVIQISQFYDREVKYATAINVLTTIVSIGTMPLIIALYYL